MIPIDKFRALLSNAITKHYTKMNGDLENLYGYSLYTEDGLSSIGGVCNTEDDISVATSDDMYDYYRYGAIEWQHFKDYGIFNEVNALLTEIMDCDDDAWEDQRQQVLKICLEVLASLDSSGLFGSHDSGRFIVICLSDSDNPIMDQSAKALNTQEVYEAYAKQFTC